MPRNPEERRKARGVPPPATFSLAELPDDGWLTQQEVAAVKRQSVGWTEKERYSGRDKLEWDYLNGWPRCRVGSLKKALASNSDVRRPPVPRVPKMQTAERSPAAARRAR
jgi:hypothetical protein